MYMSIEKQFITIKSGSLINNYWIDLWRHRELLVFLAWRDILVRYKQTVLGVTWVVIRPLLLMLILTAVFGRLAKLPSGDMPYAITVFSGLLPWFFFSSALSDCSNSLTTNSHLISKVYFPRMIVPASTILVSMVDFVISIGILVLLMFWYEIPPTFSLLLIPVMGVWVGVLAFGLGMWFSTLTVQYRDFRHLIPFVLQLGIYVSPVAYISSVIPIKWGYLYYLNPMAGVIDSFRWAILGTYPSVYGIIVSLVLTVVLLVTGVVFFRAKEALFADDI